MGKTLSSTTEENFFVWARAAGRSGRRSVSCSDWLEDREVSVSLSELSELLPASMSSGGRGNPPEPADQNVKKIWATVPTDIVVNVNINV